MLVTLMVFVIPLLGTVCSLYVIGSVPVTCPEFTKQFCACNGTENPKIVPMRMCSYGNECKPCAMELQDNIDCSMCPGDACPVCSENESSLRTTNKKADVKALFAKSERKSRRSPRGEPLPHDSWCVFQRNMLNGQVECTFTTYSKECLLSCYEPYSVNGQRELAFACKRKENVWKPEIQACEDKSERYNEPAISKESQQPQQHSMENANEPVPSAKTENDRNSDFHFGSASEDDDLSDDLDDDGQDPPPQSGKGMSVITHTSGPLFKDDKGSELVDEGVMKDFYDLLNSD